MNIVTVVARILLGLIFTAAGASGFFLIGHPPPAPPGLAGTFQDVFFQSRWVLFVDSVQLIGGVLLLVNRFVAFALVMLAAVIANIFVFHLTMAPMGLPAPVILSVLWVLVALRHRTQLMPLLNAQS